MAKILLLVLLVAGAFLLVKNYQRTLARQQRERSDPQPAPAESMVRCARCGVHLPKSESFLSQGRFFCSEEHRKLGAPDSGQH